MEISTIPLLEPITRNTQSAVAPATEPAVPNGVNADSSAALMDESVQTSPAVLVSITREPTPAPVYTEPLATLNRLRDDSHTGTAARATSQGLLSSLNQVTDGKAPFSVANVFSQISSLSKETTEYRNEARQFKVPQKLLTEKFSPDFAAARGKKAESVNLSVRTKEGDSIQIQMSRINYKDGSSGIEFSFVVDGNLSEAEQKALGQLSEKLAQVSDTFFRTGTTELRGLKDVDTSVISGFNLTLQRPKGDSLETHSYDYRIDEVAQTHTLSAEDSSGYTVDITSALKPLSDRVDVDTNVLKQYIELIRKATDDSDTPSGTQRFMLDVFSGFFPDSQLMAKDDGTTQTPSEKSIAAFDSGLPDFKATFRSPVFHNPNFYSQTSAMVLTIQQQTSTEKNQDNLLIKQESHYEFINNRFEPLPGLEFPDLAGGNYLYVKQRIEATTSRILSMTGDRVNNLWVEQDASDNKNVSRYENRKLVDEDSRTYEDRNVQDFVELLEKYNANHQQFAVDELLASSKKQLFLRV